MIVTREQLKAQLSFTDDLGGADDELLEAKLGAAQSYIERALGYQIEERFAAASVPADLIEAVLQLAAWWYENRETVNVGNIVSPVPFGVSDIISANRDWSF